MQVSSSIELGRRRGAPPHRDLGAANSDGDDGRDDAPHAVGGVAGSAVGLAGSDHVPPCHTLHEWPEVYRGDVKSAVDVLKTTSFCKITCLPVSM